MLTGEFNAQGVTRVLEAVRHVDTSIKIYQASSSEMFGKVREVPQTELTPFYPHACGVSKVFGHYITVNYKATRSSPAPGILFNHGRLAAASSSCTRKVSDGVARVKLGLADTLHRSAISTRTATGVLRATTCAPCG